MQPEKPYEAVYPVGSKVRVADRAFLQNFKETWVYHHKLLPEQLDMRTLRLQSNGVAFYHGGDQLYNLQGVPGIWHPECLRPQDE